MFSSLLSDAKKIIPSSKNDDGEERENEQNEGSEETLNETLADAMELKTQVDESAVSKEEETRNKIEKQYLKELKEHESKKRQGTKQKQESAEEENDDDSDSDEQEEFERIVNGEDDEKTEMLVKNLKASHIDTRKLKRSREKLGTDGMLIHDNDDSDEEAETEDANQQKNKKKFSKAEKEEQQKRTIFVGNVPIPENKNLVTLKKELKHFFSETKPSLTIEKIYFRSIGMKNPGNHKYLGVIKKEFSDKRDTLTAYCVLPSPSHVAEATKLNGSIFKGKHLIIDKAVDAEKHNTRNSVFVGNLPFDCQEESLFTIFSKLGKVVSVRIIRDSQYGIGKGFGYVTFNTPLEAKEATKATLESIGGRIPRVMSCKKNLSNKSKNIGVTTPKRKQENNVPVFGAKEHRPSKKRKNNEGKEIIGLAGTEIVNANELHLRNKKLDKKLKKMTPAQWKNTKAKTEKKEKTKFKPKHLKRTLARMEAEGISATERAKFAARKAQEAKLKTLQAQQKAQEKK